MDKNKTIKKIISDLRGWKRGCSNSEIYVFPEEQLNIIKDRLEVILK